MRTKFWLSAIAGIMALGLTAMPSEAAPLNGATGSLNIAATETSQVQKAHYGRRCWRHRGHVHCRRRVAYYPYYHGGYSPYYYGPSFALSFGGFRHHHHRRYRRW